MSCFRKHRRARELERLKCARIDQSLHRLENEIGIAKRQNQSLMQQRDAAQADSDETREKLAIVKRHYEEANREHRLLKTQVDNLVQVCQVLRAELDQLDSEMELQNDRINRKLDSSNSK